MQTIPFVANNIRSDTVFFYTAMLGDGAMGLTKLRLPAILGLICIAAFVNFLQVKANEETDDLISAAAVWNPDDDDLADIVDTCQTGADYGKCFVDEMGNFASSEAVAFSQSLLQQNPSRAGYLKDLREAGSVDLGIVAYPAAAGFMQGWVLVNGAPTIVNVDDLKLLPQPAMEKEPQFQALRAKYPRLRLVVEEATRSADVTPPILALGEGSQRFVIDYALKEPCQTCPAVAHASFGFDFDPTGRFLGAKFIKIESLDR
jgi:hypothetical protein